jgi:hypothetical protein
VFFFTFNDDAAEETCDMIFDCFGSLGVSSSEVDFFCAFDDSIVFLFKKPFKTQKQVRKIKIIFKWRKKHDHE